MQTVEVSTAVEWFLSGSEQLLMQSFKFRVLSCSVRAKAKTLFTRSLLQPIVGMQPMILCTLKSLKCTDSCDGMHKKNYQTATDAEQATATKYGPSPTTSAFAVYAAFGVV